MAKFKAYDYRQRVFLPVSLEEQLLPGTLEFAIHTLVDTRLDTSGFEQKYRKDETGRRAYDSKILLKIVLLGYALACGQQPDHSTIATFVSSMKDEILPLFRDVLLVCQEMDLLGGDLLCPGRPQAARQCLQGVERDPVRVAPEAGTARSQGEGTAGRTRAGR